MLSHVLKQLGGRLPLILDGGPTAGGIPSTVVDCTGLEPKVLRLGPVTLEEIISAWKEPETLIHHLSSIQVIFI